MNKKAGGSEHVYRAIEVALRVGFLGILIIWCFNILSPLMIVVLWGVIIAVGLHPIHLKLTILLKGREKLSAVGVSILGIIFLIMLTIFFFNVTVDNLQGIGNIIEKGEVDIPLPYERLVGIPVVGEELYEGLDFITDNIEETFEKFKPQLKRFTPKLLGMTAKLGVTILQFVISIIIAGVFLVNAEVSRVGVNKVLSILMGEYVDGFPEVAAASIRSVVQGVLGIGIIQGVLSGIGMSLVGVPGVGILSLIVMIVSIMQLPVPLILLPIAGYVFTTTSTMIGSIYLIWSLLVGFLDNILKPILLGRGMDVPMLVILLGAVGGMIRYGIIGLFVGPVVLVLGYKVLETLVEKNAKGNIKIESN